MPCSIQVPKDFYNPAVYAYKLPRYANKTIIYDSSLLHNFASIIDQSQVCSSIINYQRSFDNYIEVELSMSFNFFKKNYGYSLLSYIKKTLGSPIALVSVTEKSKIYMHSDKVTIINDSFLICDFAYIDDIAHNTDPNSFLDIHINLKILADINFSYIQEAIKATVSKKATMSNSGQEFRGIALVSVTEKSKIYHEYCL